MATQSAGTFLEPEKKKRQRSPNYPAVGLKEAIDRLKLFMKEDGRAGAAPGIAAKHIGFSTAHGQAYSVLAALKKFGLVEDKDGRLIPTQRAVEINSLPESDPRRLKAIRDAALSPAIYAELIAQYKDTGLPATDTLAGELEAYKGFNPNAVKEFLKGFKDTLDFAGLTDFSVLGSELTAEDDGAPKVKIGDFVQWECRGQIQFREPKRVRSFSDDGQYVFVDGSNTGMPIAEVSVEEAPANPPNLPRIVPPPREARTGGGSATMRQDVFSITEGDVVLSWPTPLSSDSIEEIKDWLRIAERKISRSEVTDVPLPQCQCGGCTNQAHRSGTHCTAKAGATGAQFCVACEAARKVDAEQAAQANSQN
jgi:hypothetical protein